MFCVYNVYTWLHPPLTFYFILRGILKKKVLLYATSFELIFMFLVQVFDFVFFFLDFFCVLTWSRLICFVIVMAACRVSNCCRGSPPRRKRAKSRWRALWPLWTLKVRPKPIMLNLKLMIELWIQSTMNLMPFRPLHHRSIRPPRTLPLLVPPDFQMATGKLVLFKNKNTKKILVSIYSY